jgi:CRISPR type II-A-associated protein Csn2
MRMMYNQYDTALIDSSYFNILIVERAAEFYKLQLDMNMQMDGNNELFTISEHGNILPFEKSIDWVDSIWDLDLNSKKMTGNLYRYLTDTLREDGLDTEIYRKWNEIEEMLATSFFDENSVVLNRELVSLPQILKNFEVHLDDDINKPLLDRIIDYCACKVRFDAKNIFVMNQVLAYLENDDIMELSKYCANEKIHLLMLEKAMPNIETLFNGRILVIDADLCELIVRET